MLQSYVIYRRSAQAAEMDQQLVKRHEEPDERIVALGQVRPVHLINIHIYSFAISSLPRPLEADRLIFAAKRIALIIAKLAQREFVIQVSRYSPFVPVP